MALPKRKDPQYQLQAILSRRDHSVHEIRQKLSRQKFSPAEVEKAITWAIAHRYLDDAHFALSYIRSVTAHKPVGPRYLKAKLQQKGVALATIEAALNQGLPPARQEELVRAAARYWLRTHDGDARQIEKLTRFLQARGFSYESIKHVNAIAESAPQPADE